MLVGIGTPKIFLLAGGDWPWGYMEFMFDFKNCVMKIMSKSLSLYLLRLQVKLKLEKKKIYLLVALIFFCIPMYWSSADFSGGWSINHLKPLISSCLQNLCFYQFCFLVAAARQQPPWVWKWRFVNMYVKSRVRRLNNWLPYSGPE